MIYKTGETPGKGTYRCTKCGFLVHLYRDELQPLGRVTPRGISRRALPTTPNPRKRPFFIARNRAFASQGKRRRNIVV